MATTNYSTLTGIPVVQPVISEWESFTPTGSWTTNATYAGRRRRVGTSMEILFEVSLSGAPNAVSLTFNLPTGYTIDTAALTASAQLTTHKLLSMGSIRDVGVNTYLIAARYVSTGAVGVTCFNENGSGLTIDNDVTANHPLNFGNNDVVTLQVIVPISEWAGQAYVAYGSGLATATVPGLVGTGTQTFAGAKVHRLTSASTFGSIGAPTQFRFGANYYNDSAGAGKAITTGSGSAFFNIEARTSASDPVFSWVTNPTSQTADASISGSSSTVMEMTTGGKLTTGPDAGLGTSGTAYHLSNGSVVSRANSSSTAGVFAAGATVALATNCYRDGASAFKAITTGGMGRLVVEGPTNPSSVAFSFETNTTSQTANTAISGTTTARMTIASNGQIITAIDASDNLAFFRNSNAAPVGLMVQYTGAAPNGTGNKFLQCVDTSTTRCEIRSNGGIANFSANDANLSDARLKNITGLTGSKLEKLCQLEVTDFAYKDAPDKKVTGLIAQQVQSVSPELVDIGGTASIDGQEVEVLAVRTTDLYHYMLKAIQEQQAIIESLNSRIEVLEAL